MIIKINIAHGKKIVAICDDDLQGRVIEENDKILDLSADFYKGKHIDEEQTTVIMKKSNNLNLVGEQTIALALKEKIIEKENIRTIKSIPFAHTSIIRD